MPNPWPKLFCLTYNKSKNTPKIKMENGMIKIDHEAFLVTTIQIVRKTFFLFQLPN